MDIKVTSIHEFIEEISKRSSELERSTSCRMFVFRGEQKNYSTSGMPNIFRDDTYMKILKSPIYEKNVIDEVIMNKLSSHKIYLQAAMDAQHGGFPSRLLDTTFNSLIALFFATTPHFTKSIDSQDNSDGVVLVYAVEKMYSSNSSTIQKFFENIITPNNLLNSSRINGYAHKFIDHSDINSRIKSQQGGFVLFSGNQFIPIPEWRQKKIIIDKNFKQKIRKDLKKIFGITMGSIYPEADNLVGYLTEKAEILVENSEDQSSEIYYELEKNIEYFNSLILKAMHSKCSNKFMLDKILEIELYLLGFMQSFEDVIEISKPCKANNFNDQSAKCYKLIGDFLDELSKRIPSNMTTMSLDNLKKLVGGNL
ncbi:FRG domain-containing protein [Enterococcus sp. AZ072]|uniref:FRG domain-containing protein n=1 Tax=unclassified Enterococcus TaxID=2608891 RepID=UPI003D2B4E55